MKSLVMMFVVTSSLSYASFSEGPGQLLVVTSKDWKESEGSLQCYEKRDAWMPVGEPIRVVLGRKGMAWGVGLHPLTLPLKREGDGKSPAGIFSLGCVFGVFSDLSLRMPYLLLDEFIEAVDDPDSRYYNHVLDRREVDVDWKSAELMGKESLYTLGVIVHHNFPLVQAGAGSAIFLHIWRGEKEETAGCTAMSQEDLEKIVSWLEFSKGPLLVQLPRSIYESVKAEWALPDLVFE